MNQKQLEAAIRRVSTDPSLEPQVGAGRVGARQPRGWRGGSGWVQQRRPGCTLTPRPRPASNNPPAPQRKAYLRQNIMASHYIVTQQRRMHSGGSSTAATPTALAAAGMRDGLRLAGTPLAGSGGGGGVVAAAVASAQQQQQQQQQQVGAAPAAAATQQQQAQQQQQQQAQPAPPQQAVGERRAPAIPRYHDAAAGVLGCRHYRRRCMLVAPCCDTPHVCRLCHDEASDHQVGGLGWAGCGVM